uniref:phosphoribosylaminoimidazole carboxylase n=1 Tax=Pinguiococcus pyrenoidosus TaxID=172671 RepID=A0A7R9Y8U5_9STRA
MRAYPVVQTVQKDNICHTVLAPAKLPPRVLEEAQRIAITAVASLQSRGIFGVEMFATAEGEVLYNEMAPRPHNSGHYTIEACDTCQFENHLRAILGLPLGAVEMRTGAALMLNVLGEDSMRETKNICQAALEMPGAALHWYGKAENRKGRKMAHFTVSAQRGYAHLAERLATSPTVLQNLAEPTKAVLGIGAPAMPKSEPSHASPLVGIIMGSDSDLGTMQAAAEVLKEFEIPFEITIVSAHRTPRRLFDYSQSAASRGLKVIIAGAGGAAHLPGMVSALTPLPVIGVPVKTSTLSGVDSLYSIVQMPRGVPVATVAIGNAKNAGLLAARMLGGCGGLPPAQAAELVARMETFQSESESEVLRKAETLEGVGYEQYLASMGGGSKVVGV